MDWLIVSSSWEKNGNFDRMLNLRGLLYSPPTTIMAKFGMQEYYIPVFYVHVSNFIRGGFTLGVQAFEAWLYTFMSH